MAKALGSTARERLSPERERALVAAAASGEQAARDQAVEIFMPLIGSVARTYSRVPGVERAELIQEGVAGLLKAIGRFDPELGTPFWAYASWWVRQAMQRLVAELGRPVVLSDRALRQLARVKDARSEYLRSSGREPTLFELAADTGFPKEQIEALLAVERMPRGLGEPRRDGGGTPDPLVDAVADPRAEDDYDRVLPGPGLERLRRLCADLCEREGVVVRARFGVDGPAQTLREIGAQLGLSAERVRQIEARALDHLRAAVC
jgi:RNA polymerase sigma factor (sigma-70 family)